MSTTLPTTMHLSWQYYFFGYLYKIGVITSALAWKPNKTIKMSLKSTKLSYLSKMAQCACHYAMGCHKLT